MSEFEPCPVPRSRWCETCKQWGHHHTDRHARNVCACGNLFAGDNLCMASACQWEDLGPLTNPRPEVTP